MIGTSSSTLVVETGPGRQVSAGPKFIDVAVLPRHQEKPRIVGPIQILLVVGDKRVKPWDLKLTKFGGVYQLVVNLLQQVAAWSEGGMDRKRVWSEHLLICGCCQVETQGHLLITPREFSIVWFTLEKDRHYL